MRTQTNKKSKTPSWGEELEQRELLLMQFQRDLDKADAEERWRQFGKKYNFAKSKDLVFELQTYAIKQMPMERTTVFLAFMHDLISCIEKTPEMLTYKD